MRENFLKIARNSLRNCEKFAQRDHEIYFKIVWNSPKNWVKISWKLCEIFLKLSEILLEVEWNYSSNKKNLKNLKNYPSMDK